MARQINFTRMELNSLLNALYFCSFNHPLIYSYSEVKPIQDKLIEMIKQLQEQSNA